VLGATQEARETAYDVAFSFAGEDRVYVEAVAENLRTQGIKVFYDAWEEAELWGKNLYTRLDDVYQNQARFTVLFASQHYAEKLWTNHELQSAQARAFREREEYVLPARFDDTQIPGVRSTIAYIDLRRKTPQELAQLIAAKLNCTGRGNASVGHVQNPPKVGPSGVRFGRRVLRAAVGSGLLAVVGGLAFGYWRREAEFDLFDYAVVFVVLILIWEAIEVAVGWVHNWIAQGHDNNR
jgi:hypothetical protein